VPLLKKPLPSQLQRKLLLLKRKLLPLKRPLRPRARLLLRVVRKRRLSKFRYFLNPRKAETHRRLGLSLFGGFGPLGR